MATVLDAQMRADLEAHRVGDLATAGAKGLAHVAPVTCAVSDRHVVFVVDEKLERVHGTALTRLRNIIANPQAAFLVEDHDEDWSRLGDALIQRGGGDP